MTSAAQAPTAWWATAPLPGAIGILHIHGEIEETLREIAGRVPDVGTTTLASLASIDHGVLARPSESSALLMPHGGPRIRTLLTEAVASTGATIIDGSEADPRDRWPEAKNLVEACMLDALARAGSPRAVQMLLMQPDLHAEAAAREATPDHSDLERSRMLDRLIDPPLVAIVGAPNVGKSTLMNRLAGRDVAITADLAGTTRDTVTARVDLDGVACDIVDLPGRRPTDDAIEAHAQQLARTFIREADLLVALVDPIDSTPPELDRTPELVVCNKSDLGSVPNCMSISALDGSGIEQLALEIRCALIPDAVLQTQDAPWYFHPRLTQRS